MGQLIRNKKRDIIKLLSAHEERLLFKVLPKVGMSEEEYSKLKARRKFLWRGFVPLCDFMSTLKEFEFKYQELSDIKSFVQIMKCFNEKHQLVNYMKLCQNIYRKTSKISQFTDQFQWKARNVIREELEARLDRSLPQKEQSQVVFGALLPREYLRFREIQQKKKDLLKNNQLNLDDLIVSQEQQERNRIMKESKKGAEQIIKLIREKVHASSANLREIFQSFDENRDQYITQDEFLKAFQQAQLSIEAKVLVEAFNRLDFNKDKKISYMDFLTAMFEEEDKPGMSDYMKHAEHIINDMHIFFRGQFENYRSFKSRLECQDTGKVTEEEFTRFLTGIQTRYSLEQVRLVFKFLDKDQKGYLINDEFCEVYEHLVQKVPINFELIK